MAFSPRPQYELPTGQPRGWRPGDPGISPASAPVPSQPSVPRAAPVPMPSAAPMQMPSLAPTPAAPEAAPSTPPAVEALQQMQFGGGGDQGPAPGNFIFGPGSLRQGIGERDRPSLTALQGLRY